MNKGQRNELKRKKNQRKLNIIRAKMGDNWWIKKPHWIVNKVFFASPYRKTRNTHRKEKNYAPSYNPSPSDRRKLDKMNAETEV